MHWSYWVAGLFVLFLGLMLLAAGTGYGLGHINPYAASLGGLAYVILGGVGLSSSWCWTRSERNR